MNRGEGRRRPRRAWYLVAVLAVLAAAGLTWRAYGGGEVGERITPGQAATVDVPAGGIAIWATTASYDVRCEPSGTEDVGWGMTTMRFVPAGRPAGAR